MATTYLMTCGCGDQVAVEPRQAGEKVRCGCGIELVAPTLRQMRQLPQADSHSAPGNASPPPRGWGAHHGVLTAGLLASALLAASGGYFWVSEPPPPAPFDAAAYNERSAATIESWTPAVGLQAWAAHYRQAASNPLMEFTNPQNELLQEEVDFYRLCRNTLLTLAGVAAALTLLFFALLSAGSPSRRPS